MDIIYKRKDMSYNTHVFSFKTDNMYYKRTYFVYKIVDFFYKEDFFCVFLSIKKLEPIKISVEDS